MARVPFNITSARKLVRRSTTQGRTDDRLFVCEHDDRLWATNSHWLAPADWFDAIRKDDDWKPGTWNAATSEYLHDDAPNISSLFPELASTIVLEPLVVEGVGPVITNRGNDDLCVYTLADARFDGQHAAFNRRYLEMFLGQEGRYDQQWRIVSQGPLKVAVVQHSSSYTRAHGPAETTWHTEGLLMPVRLS